MRNRNVTYESLRAAVNLLYCDNEDEFNRLYCLATHSKGGRHIWWCMFNKDVKAKELYHKKKSLMNSFEKSEKARASQPNSKPIRCLELNLVFSSTHEAANYFDIEISCIRYAIKNNKGVEVSILNTLQDFDLDSLFHPKGYKPVDKNCETCYNYMGSHACDICHDFNLYTEDKGNETRDKKEFRW